MLRPFGRNDAGGHGFLQSERTADRQHPVSHLHAVRIAQLCDRERLVAFNLDDGQVGFLIRADDFGVAQHSRRIVLQLHPNTVCLLHHVAVGDDITLGIDDHA